MGPTTTTTSTITPITNTNTSNKKINKKSVDDCNEWIIYCHNIHILLICIENRKREKKKQKRRDLVADYH